MNISADSGLYQLVVSTAKPCRIQVGRLGEHEFAAGFYVYTGSARKSLRARVARHARGAPRLHWHIDYLLQKALCVAYRAYIEPEFSECELNLAAAKLPGGLLVCQGFGSSDCRCYSHLVYFSNWAEVQQIFQLDFENRRVK